MSQPLDRVPFLDLRVTDDEERTALLAAVDGVLRHGRIVLGPEVAALEEKVRARVGRAHAIGVNSGTDALILALRALGIGAGDEVIVPALSFVATANVVSLLGAEPVFADLKDDLTVDPASVERFIGPRTKAIMPVHWAGKICDMAALGAIAEKHGLPIIEDSSQAFGAVQGGKASGAFGLIGCYSMNCMKLFASVGEAGMVVTDDPALAEKLDQLRYHGLVNRESCLTVSHNGRLDTIQAAMLMVRLERLDALLARRREIAAFYDKALAGLVEVPSLPEGDLHAYYTYTIQCDDRDGLKAHLDGLNIETKIQHPILMPEQPVYKDRAKGDWTNALERKKRYLCIPANEKISDAERTYVANAIRQYFGQDAL